MSMISLSISTVASPYQTRWSKLQEQLFNWPQGAVVTELIDIAKYFRFRLRRVPLKKALIFIVDVVRHWPAMLPLLLAPRGSNLRRLVTTCPEILFMASGPYLAENWGARQRFSRIIDHCKTVGTIGGIVDLPPDASRDLCRLTPIDSRYRLIVHQPREYVWEGQLDLTLCDGTRPIFSLRFCLSSQHGERIAYVGALQGRAQKAGEPNIIETYNLFSKAAARMRPRDFMIEAFQMVCRTLDVKTILAVADDNKPRRCFAHSYDEDWRARGGVDNGDGFFMLPVVAKRRVEGEVPSKKKAMYRKRYDMLSSVEAAITTALQEEPMPA